MKEFDLEEIAEKLAEENKYLKERLEAMEIILQEKDNRITRLENKVRLQKMRLEGFWRNSEGFK